MDVIHAGRKYGGVYSEIWWAGVIIGAISCFTSSPCELTQCLEEEAQTDAETNSALFALLHLHAALFKDCQE